MSKGTGDGISSYVRKVLLCVPFAIVACSGAANNDLFSGGASSSGSASSSSSSSGGRGGGGGGGGNGGGGVDPGNPGCPVTEFFRDRDDDGYGNPAQAMSACSSPGKGWVTQAGDCNDDNGDVHPGQTAFFEEPYEIADGSGEEKLSFDYDCSGGEEQELAPPRAGVAAKCTFNLTQCVGSGFVPVENRAGTGIDPLCGSTQFQRCQFGINPGPGNNCVAQLEDVDPAPCR